LGSSPQKDENGNAIKSVKAQRTDEQGSFRFSLKEDIRSRVSVFDEEECVFKDPDFHDFEDGGDVTVYGEIDPEEEPEYPEKDPCAELPDLIRVPRVIGATEQDAQTKIADAKLTYAESGQQVTDGEPGRVVSQIPQPGELAREGDTVSVIMSKAKEVVELPTTRVPPIVGDVRETARKALEQAKLNEDYRGEEDANLDIGLVTQQDPPANAEVPENSHVKYWVSRGVFVGDYSNKMILDAAKAIREQGLNGEIVELKFHDSIPKNHVISHQPVNTFVNPESQVNFVVSQGITPVVLPPDVPTVSRMPDLGKSLGKVEAELRKVPHDSVTLELHDGRARSPKVIEQSPAKNTDVSAPLNIHLTIQVPDSWKEDKHKLIRGVWYLNAQWLKRESIETSRRIRERISQLKPQELGVLFKGNSARVKLMFPNENPGTVRRLAGALKWANTQFSSR